MRIIIEGVTSATQRDVVARELVSHLHKIGLKVEVVVPTTTNGVVGPRCQAMLDKIQGGCDEDHQVSLFLMRKVGFPITVEVG